MYRNELISLKSISTTIDEAGDTVPTIKLREVFAKKKSVKQSEFYQAQAVGLKPELVFEIHPTEYEDEKEVVYNQKNYKVIRTYQVDNESLEIVAEGDINGSTQEYKNN